MGLGRVRGMKRQRTAAASVARNSIPGNPPRDATTDGQLAVEGASHRANTQPKWKAKQGAGVAWPAPATRSKGAEIDGRLVGRSRSMRRECTLLRLHHSAAQRSTATGRERAGEGSGSCVRVAFV